MTHWFDWLSRSIFVSLWLTDTETSVLSTMVPLLRVIPRRGWLQQLWTWSPLLMKTPSTSYPTTTINSCSRRSSLPVSLSFSSMALQVSLWVWRRILHLIIFQKQSPQRSIFSSIPMLPLLTSCVMYPVQTYQKAVSLLALRVSRTPMKQDVAHSRLAQRFRSNVSPQGKWALSSLSFPIWSDPRRSLRRSKKTFLPDV